jgi:hypothetical protein
MFLEESVKLEDETLATNGTSRSRWVTLPEMEPDPKLVDRMRPDVLARRSRYVRYVVGVCAACVLVGLAAVLKLMLQ